MPDAVTLETPTDVDAIYYARGDEVALLAARPLFTGDIIRLSGDLRVCILQHPCAIRRGANLLPQLLVGELLDNVTPPQDWASGHFKRMFLPDLDGAGSAVDFTRMLVIDSGDLAGGSREAILSVEGVDLLLQRWIYHNSRVIIPTLRFHSQIAGPFEEADLFMELSEVLVARGLDADRALQAIDGWLSAEYAPGSPSRRDMLGNPQTVSSIRKKLRQDADAGMLGP